MKRLTKKAEKMKKGELDPDQIVDPTLAQLTPEIMAGIGNKNIAKKLRKHLNDDSRILDADSRSRQTWDNIPRFHMDLIMGKMNDKKKK